MYTLKYQIERAVQIADENPEACIGVFCKWDDAKEILQNMKPYGEIRWQSRVFKSYYGASVRFIHTTTIDSLWGQYCRLCL